MTTSTTLPGGTRALGDLKPYLSMQAASLLRATGATQ